VPDPNRGGRPDRARLAPHPGTSRRAFLGAGLAAGAAALLSACGSGGSGDSAAGTTTTSAPSPTTSSSTTTSTTATTQPAVARFVDHGDATADAKQRVALTFHMNGDLGLVTQLLDVFTAHRTTITAFVVGNWLEANPSFGRQLVDAGHEVANHTYTHPSFVSLSHDEMYVEIMKCRDVLVRTTGTPGVFFRPSGTDDGTAAPPPPVLSVSAEAGYATVLGFDVDPLDYEDPGADAVTQRTLAAVEPGSIVSMHFGHAGTVAAMPAILDGLAQRGLAPVTASKLLA
jgi:peptidoglycan/xylan/chitin deacetylase (PgdA/CDA1 family)